MVGVIEVSVAHEIDMLCASLLSGKICRCSIRAGMASPLWVTENGVVYGYTLESNDFYKKIFLMTNHCTKETPVFFLFFSLNSFMNLSVSCL